MSQLSAQIAKLSPEKRELFELMLMEQGVDLSQLMIVPLDRTNTVFPLSYSQQRLWFLDQLEPNSSLYNISPALILEGQLDIEALQKSFNEIIRRHEVLRTSFDKTGDNPVQVIANQLEITIKQIDFKAISPDHSESDLQSYILAESQRPFNLSEGPLLRVTLLKLSQTKHVLILVKHHIISDNWSTGLMVHELIQLYTAFSLNQSSPLADLSVQYADFAHWQRKWLKGKTLESQISYWREQLEGAPSFLEMPFDKPRPAYQTYNGDFRLFKISEANTKAIMNLARSEESTLFMVLISLYFILLQRYSGQEDILIGSPIANRNRKEIEPLIGFFINTIILRGDLSGDPTFKEFLFQVKEMTLGAYDHQDIPFETLVEELQPGRDMSHSPFFQSMFVLNNVHIEKLELPNLKLSLLEVENKSSKFDLILNVTETDSGLDCKIEFNTDLYFPETIDRMIRQYQFLLKQVLTAPETAVGELALLSTTEKEEILKRWNKADHNYAEPKSIIELIQDQTEKAPNALAIRIKKDSLTYSELNEQVDQLAVYLLKIGLKNGQIIGVSMERSVNVLVSMLAIFKAGGVYLPLDPAYPKDRLEFMLSDSRATILISDKENADSLSSVSIESLIIDGFKSASGESVKQTVFSKIAEKDSAYIIYTSGSTGKPKGVEITHGAMTNHCCDMRDYYHLNEDDNVLQFAALNFDASIEQILPPLISGATVIMRDTEIWDSARFSQNIKKFDLTVINPPTAYWAQLAADWAQDTNMLPENRIRLVIVGGDILKPEALKLWHQTALKDVRLLNAYGPTESIITASTFPVPSDFNGHKLPIGKPRANRRFYVLDTQKNPVPFGMPGELYIGGKALAKGYLNRPDITDERFIPDPFSELPDQRMYSTGDRVRFLPDGNLEFLGRIDFQVKIRGFRIELAEIESILDRQPQVTNSIVNALPDKQGNLRLVAYFTAKDKPQDSTLRVYLETELPDYMVPSLFVHLDKFPIDPSGKANRRLLPTPDFSQVRTEVEFVEPRTETEQILVDMVKSILQVDRVGIMESFFDLGGQSMMATQVVSRIRESFDVELSLRAMFERPTVEGIALSITEAQATYQDEDELESMLSEIETLSDEELDALLKE